ncbi:MULTISPECIES: YggT family protein [unclassified Curtobacterium]|uniref:YggT family protein n=1 Tax=unclassified Curtobacterium TaxID=257496 RepID=UPI0008F1262C|nr:MULTISPECIES: YggT family protein [unclassified Curtobacterium]MCC8909499.1 YggT family protein [Curtobacterium sp. GD1]SFF89174.1 YggT family protein [Curtobacterium sp. YR515]
MTAILTILSYLLLLYILVLWGRFVLDIVQQFNRSWRPRGALLVVADVVYTVTDPPIRAVRRVLPPMRMGPVALDFGWTIVLLLAIIIRFVIALLIPVFAN